MSFEKVMTVMASILSLSKGRINVEKFEIVSAISLSVCQLLG
jgi:hypothetical protein